MTTQQIMGNEQKRVLLEEFSNQLKTAAAHDSRLKFDPAGNNAGAITYQDNLCSFVSDNSTMDLYFCKQIEFRSRRGNPDQTLYAVPMNASVMCWQDESGTRYSSQELVRYCCQRVLEGN